MYALPIVLAAGCASATATTQSQTAPLSKHLPSQIVVYPFAVRASDVTLNQSIVQRAYRHISGENVSAAQLQLGRQVAQDMCDEVADQLKKKGRHAVCQQRGIPVHGENVLIVDGAFADVNEGNRLRRTVIGLGAGASTLDTNVHVYQHVGERSDSVLDFSTHADSGKLPGAGVMAPAGIAAGAAAGGVAATNVAMAGAKGYTASMKSLADKTASQITNQLDDYLAQYTTSTKPDSSDGD